MENDIIVNLSIVINGKEFGLKQSIPKISIQRQLLSYEEVITIVTNNLVKTILKDKAILEKLGEVNKGE